MDEKYIDKAILIGLRQAHDTVVTLDRKGYSTGQIIEVLREVVEQEGGQSERPTGTYEEQYQENAR